MARILIVIVVVATALSLWYHFSSRSQDDTTQSPGPAGLPASAPANAR
jgi:hypothetical protein